MNTNVNPVLVKQEIGRRLRAARHSARLNLDEAAGQLEITRSSLNRLETGLSGVSVHLVRAMMQVYRWEDEEVLDLVRKSRLPGWWKYRGVSDRDFIAVESGASLLSSFEPDVVPGLLQTADYARALFQAGRQSRSEEWIDNQLDIRMTRQERLVDENHPLELIAVINEFVLRRPVGGSAVMRSQLRHLVLATELPTVSMQVLPASVVSTEATHGAFVVLDFPSAGQPSIVHVQHVLGAERKDKPEQVAAAKLRLDHLRSLALDTEESIALIEWVSDRLWSG